jgi:hypothetical protein
MHRFRKWFDTPAPNWIMAAVSVFMLTQYLGLIEIADSDRADMLTALAWAFMLGIWLSTAIYKTRIRTTRRNR